MLTRTLAPLLLVLTTLPCPAQRGIGSIDFQLMIVLEGERHPFNKEITVTVFDGWGNIEQALTTRLGMVGFLIPPGIHRLSIVGSDIEPYYDEFDLDLEPARLRTIQVEPKRKLAEPRETKGTVASVRLNIPKNAGKEFERAQAAWKKKNWNDAKAHLQKAISKYAQYDAAYAALGVAEIQLGDREAGRRDLQKATQLNPNNTPASRKLAELYIAESNYAAAEPFLQTTLRDHPQEPWALSYAALGELVQGRFTDALANAQKVHTVSHRGFESAHMIAAQALEGLKRPDEARAEYQLYVSEAPNGQNITVARTALQRLSSEPQTGRSRF
jgi:tetratricopeptide (TPR) repeat protein